MRPKETAECGTNDMGLQAVDITNINGLRTLQTVITRSFYQPGVGPVSEPITAPGIFPVRGSLAPSQSFHPIGCTTFSNGSVINPINYTISYQVTATYALSPTQSGGGGVGRCGTNNPGCCPDAATPHLTSGLAPDPSANPPRHHVADGSYQLRSQVQLRGSGPNPYIPPQPLCIELRADRQSEPGRLQQQDCRRTGEERFYLHEVESHLYMIMEGTLGGRVLLPRNDESGGSEILGLGIDQVTPPTCTYRVAKTRSALQEVLGTPNVYRIVNQATGDCLQIDGNRVERESLVNTVGCRGTNFEKWQFVPF